jgi:drug/metabolite transporter (DMT)-like permease
MALRGSDNRRGFSDNIVISVAAGFLLGVAAFFAKLTMSDISVLIIISPTAWIALIFAGAGFLLMQKALQGYVSKIIPIITGVSILVSVGLAFVFLGDMISYAKGLGIFLVLVGVFGLVKAK